ncbi:hypothetical protein [Luteimonas huabeiensis]|uniref:hypothetical protein n=1 Tax=Luteimonas huabeiensis TaxID=1244513 RepID=UPI00191C5E3B|nr:hypothetical protein [Luteimonas huabeiensis]
MGAVVREGVIEMAKTCIVCGNPAGSKEHVFPAALGGRRTNSGIYCTTHDNSHSGLVGAIAGQIDFINAYLGVRPDHSDAIKTVHANDPLTGEPITISAEEIKFQQSRVLSQTPVEGGGIAMQVASPDRRAAKEWTAEMERQGYTVAFQSQPTEDRYMLGAVHHRRAFGGTCGLGAVAYIVQTFFAQEFPDVARSGALSGFIAYTQAVAKVAILGGCTRIDGERPELVEARAILAAALAGTGCSAPANWDFTRMAGAAPNAFEFGHRVIVGVDGSDGTMYGRLSLFSAFDFAVCLGTAPPGKETREVTIDIDPLAEHPPQDIRKVTAHTASSRVDASQLGGDALAKAIADGTQQQVLHSLLERLTDYQLARLVRTMVASLAPLPTLQALDRRALIAQSLDEQSQQVWRAVTYMIGGFKQQLIAGGAERVAPMLDMLVAHDVRSASGLSREAQAMLSLAKAALADQMERDFAAGALDEQRIADLMGRGPGLHIVGSAVLEPLLQAFDRNT